MSPVPKAICAAPLCKALTIEPEIMAIEARRVATLP